MTVVDVVLAGVVVVAGAAGVSIYNRLVALRRRCDQATADIAVQMKLRHDLLPNLVEVAPAVKF